MAEYINRNALLESIRSGDGANEHKIFAALCVSNAPTTDVVEVVRCKDCKYSRESNEDEQRYLVEGILICTSGEAADECWNPVYPSHFCSYGERKE